MIWHKIQYDRPIYYYHNYILVLLQSMTTGLTVNIGYHHRLIIWYLSHL